MTAIASAEPVVLLIDEIDKTDQEFEAMLLELLSDFQITIPELGRIEAQTMPLVLLTSNNTRELTEALKRRCLYLWLDYPDIEHELEIVRLHAPELDESVARRLVEVIAMVRDLDLKKPPSIAESIDWARALLLLGAQRHRRRDLPRDDVDHRQAPHRPRRRDRARRRQARTARGQPRCRLCGLGAPSRPAARRAAPRSSAARSTTRSRTAWLRTSSSSPRSCAARASPSARASCSTRSPRSPRSTWTEPVAFREALAATLAKSPDDRRIFDLVFDRFFFRAVELAAVQEDVREQDIGGGMDEAGAELNLDDAAHADRPGDRRRQRGSACATSRGWRSPRSASRARARA